MPAEALLAITVLIVLAPSSYAQCLFGLDGRAAWRVTACCRCAAGSCWRPRTRHSCWWQFPLTLPLAPLAPLAAAGAALVALALGHAPSVGRPRKQTRWRFSSGGSLVFGIFQAVLMATAAAGIFFSSRLALIPCVVAWALSVWYYGRVMERLLG